MESGVDNAGAGGARKNSGRNREMKDPVTVTYLVESTHRDKMHRLAKKFDVRGPSAALRYILDHYDF